MEAELCLLSCEVALLYWGRWSSLDGGRRRCWSGWGVASWPSRGGLRRSYAFTRILPSAGILMSRDNMSVQYDWTQILRYVLTIDCYIGLSLWLRPARRRLCSRYTCWQKCRCFCRSVPMLLIIFQSHVYFGFLCLDFLFCGNHSRLFWRFVSCRGFRTRGGFRHWSYKGRRGTWLLLFLLLFLFSFSFLVPFSAFLLPFPFLPFPWLLLL